MTIETETSKMNWSVLLTTVLATIFLIILMIIPVLGLSWGSVGSEGKTFGSGFGVELLKEAFILTIVAFLGSILVLYVRKRRR